MPRMPRTAHYGDAFAKQAKKSLPTWQYQELHRKARSAAGGIASKHARDKKLRASKVKNPPARADDSDAVLKAAFGHVTRSAAPPMGLAEMALCGNVPPATSVEAAVRDHILCAVRESKAPRAAKPMRVSQRVAKAMASASLIIGSAKAKQVAYCVALEPDAFDFHSDRMVEEEIEKTAHGYMESARVIGSMHSRAIRAVPVESYIAPQDLRFTGGPYGDQLVRKGSWVLGIKVRDPSEWAKVINGEYTGISVGGFGKRKPAQ